MEFQDDFRRLYQIAGTEASVSHVKSVSLIKRLLSMYPAFCYLKRSTRMHQKLFKKFQNERFYKFFLAAFMIFLISFKSLVVHRFQKLIFLFKRSLPVAPNF